MHDSRYTGDYRKVSSKQSLRSQLYAVLPRIALGARQAYPDRLRRIVQHLRIFCDQAERLALEVDEALSQSDIPRFNHLRFEQARVATSIQDTIIDYIAMYLDTRPSGDDSHMEIRFTDSRPLFGAVKLKEWLQDNHYLSSLLDLTRRAGARFPGEALVSRTFIVPSFTELAGDPALFSLLVRVVEQHLVVGIPASIVSLRRIEDWGLSAMNFACLSMAFS